MFMFFIQYKSACLKLLECKCVTHLTCLSLRVCFNAKPMLAKTCRRIKACVITYYYTRQKPHGLCVMKLI